MTARAIHQFFKKFSNILYIPAESNMLTSSTFSVRHVKHRKVRAAAGPPRTWFKRLFLGTGHIVCLYDDFHDSSV